MTPQLRFHLDTKALYGPQKTITSERCRKPSDFDLINDSAPKRQFESDTEALYAGSTGLHRARSLPKGVSIAEQSRYLRQLFRIPRGQKISLFPQAYVPNRNLGLRPDKKKK